MKRFLCVLFLFVTVPLWMVTSAGAVAVNPGGQGDALLGELYRVNYVTDSAYTTFFTVTNTSDTDWVEVHVRLRSGQYSIEVWDQQFIMSPMDKDWFQIEQDAGGFFIFGDKQPKEYLKMDLLNDIGFTAGGEVDQMAIGYIEVFGVAAAANVTDLETKQNLFDVDDVLMGQVYLGDWQTGEYLGYSMLAMMDFRTENFGHRDNEPAPVDKTVVVCYPQWAVDPNTAPPNVAVIPVAAFCTEVYENSDWATTHGMTWNDGDDNNDSGPAVPPGPGPYLTVAAAQAAIAGPNLGPSANWSLDEVELALMKEDIKANYFNIDKGTAVTVTLAAVTFPAKYLHFFFQNWNPGMGSFNNNTARAQREALTTPPTGVPIRIGVWDMDEHHWGSSPQQTDDLPWEVNLIPVGNVSQEYFTDSGWDLLYSPSEGLNVGPLVATYPMGWFFIEFNPLAFFTRGVSMYPGVNLVMNYETANYMHARGFPWQYTWQHP